MDTRAIKDLLGPPVAFVGCSDKSNGSDVGEDGHGVRHRVHDEACNHQIIMVCRQACHRISGQVDDLLADVFPLSGATNKRDASLTESRIDLEMTEQVVLKAGSDRCCEEAHDGVGKGEEELETLCVDRPPAHIFERALNFVHNDHGKLVLSSNMTREALKVRVDGEIDRDQDDGLFGVHVLGGPERAAESVLLETILHLDVVVPIRKGEDRSDAAID